MNLEDVAADFLDPGFPGYEVAAVGEIPVEGIFTFQYVEFDGVASNYPILTTLYGVVQEGDTVATTRGHFTVEQIEDDGTGLQRNILRRA